MMLNDLKVILTNREGTGAPGRGTACAKGWSRESLWLPEGLENCLHVYFIHPHLFALGQAVPGQRATQVRQTWLCLQIS